MRDTFNEYYTTLQDTTCKNCVYLTVNPPLKGVRGTMLNVWADQHKAVCSLYNMAWTCGDGTDIRRCFECLILEGKEVEG